MKITFLIFVLLLGALDSKDDFVPELNNENFYQSISQSDYAFVIFCNDCGPEYSRYLSQFNTATQLLSKTHPEIKFYKAKGASEERLGDSYGSYGNCCPTKLFIKGG